MRGLVSDADLGFGDRAIPAAGAAVLVNLLDVAEVCNHLRPNAVHIKTNFCLQDPRAFCRNFLGFPLFSVGPSEYQQACWHMHQEYHITCHSNMLLALLVAIQLCNPGGIHASGSFCPPGCSWYKVTLDVFNKVVDR
ncbi:mitochondrial carrier protein MTM1-like isoform X6 [Elaeis guineensis]